MAGNEGDAVAGLEVLFKLIADMQSAQAEGMKAGVRIQAELTKFSIFKPTADMAAVSGLSQKIADIGKDAERQIRLEREANIRIASQQAESATREQLRREVDAAKEASKAKANSDRDSIRLSIMADKQAAKDLAAEHKSAIRPQQVWESESLSRAAEINKSQTKESDDLRRRESDAIKRGMLERERESQSFSRMVREFGQGMPPRRSLAGMFTGGLQAMGMGETGASLVGGLGGILAGSMVFRIGWELMEIVGKIPEVIDQHMRENIAVDVTRSRLAGRGADEIDVPARTTTMSSDKDVIATLGAGGFIFNRMDPSGKGGEDFSSTLNSLAQKYMATESDPGKREAIRKQITAAAIDAEIGRLGAGGGDTLQLATAVTELQRKGSGAGAATLMNQPGVMEFMISRFRKDRGGLGVFSDSQIQSRIQSSIEAELSTPALRQRGIDSVMSAYQNVLRSNPNAAALRTQFMDQSNLFSTFLTQTGEGTFGSKEKLTFQEGQSLRDYIGFRKQGMNPEVAMHEYQKTMMHGPDIPSLERMKQLTDPMERVMQSVFQQGKLPGYISPLMGQPQFSFSSLSDFANKMQKEAGFQMDDSARTADNTASMDRKMDDLIASVNSLHPADNIGRLKGGVDVPAHRTWANGLA